MTKSCFVAAVVGLGFMAWAQESLVVNEVSTQNNDCSLRVDYALSGMNEACDYKVVFDITALSMTKSVTNAACKLSDGVYSQEFDLVGLFQSKIVSPESVLRMSLIRVPAPDAGGVQLWKDGPYWAECNVGANEKTEAGFYFSWGDTNGYVRVNDTWQLANSESGETYSFCQDNCLTYGKNLAELKAEGFIDEDKQLVSSYDAATCYLGADWRMPTASEWKELLSKCTCFWMTKDQMGTAGLWVTGKSTFASKSIFIPVAYYGSNEAIYDFMDQGFYWSATAEADRNNAQYLYFARYQKELDSLSRYNGLPLRAVRGIKVVASQDKSFSWVARKGLENSIGIASWCWHSSLADGFMRLKANCVKGVHLGLSPWIWDEATARQEEFFGDKESEDSFIAVQKVQRAGEIEIHSTMMAFSDEDYASRSSITNTSGFFYGLATGASDSDLVWTVRSNQFAEAVARTKALGVKYLTCQVGYWTLAEDGGIARIGWAADLCRANDIMLLLESGQYSGEETAAFLTELVKVRPETVIGVNFDPGSHLLYGTDNPTNAYAVLKPWIRQMHIKDAIEDLAKREELCGDWAADVEWGKGDVSVKYDFLNFITTGDYPYEGPAIVEYESTAAKDLDSREQEIMMTVHLLRGDVAIAPGESVLFASEAAAEKARSNGGVYYVIAEDVAKKLLTDGARANYRRMFEDAIVKIGASYAVEIILTSSAQSQLLDSVNAMTRTIDVQEIASWDSETKNSLKLEGGIPGFYYTLNTGKSVTEILPDGTDANRDVLCDSDGSVTFPAVRKPSPEAGFFSLRVDVKKEQKLL